jgi:hypothetical protein
MLVARQILIHQLPQSVCCRVLCALSYVQAWGGAWYRALWDRTVQAGEQQDEQLQQHAATAAGLGLHPAAPAAADTVPSQVLQPQAAQVTIPSSADGSAPTGTAAPAAAAAAGDGAGAVAVGEAPWSLREADLDSAAYAVADTASVADSAMTLEELHEREAAASMVSSQGYLSPGNSSAVSSSTGALQPSMQQQHQQQRRHQQVPSEPQQQQQQRPQQQLRRQDSASMQGPFGDEPEQHVLWQQQQQQQAQAQAQLVQAGGVDQDDLDSDLLLHRSLEPTGHQHTLSTDTAGYDFRSDGVLASANTPAAAADSGRTPPAAAGDPLAGMPSATVSAGSAVPAAQRTAAYRSQQPFLGQDSDMLLARGVPVSNSQGGSGSSGPGSRMGQGGTLGGAVGRVGAGPAAGVGSAGVTVGTGGGAVPAAVLAVEPRMDSARELTGSLSLSRPAAAVTPSTAAAGGGGSMAPSNSGRLVRADSALDNSQVLRYAEAGQPSPNNGPTTAAAAAAAGETGFSAVGPSSAAEEGAGSSRAGGSFIRDSVAAQGLNGGAAGPLGRSFSEASSLLLEARRVVLGSQGSGPSAAGAAMDAASGGAGPSLLGATSSMAAAAAAGASDMCNVYPDEVEELYSFADSLHDEHSLAAARRVVLGGAAGPSGLGGNSSSSSRLPGRPASPDDRAGASSNSSGQPSGVGGLPAVRTAVLVASSSLPARREYVLDSPRERAAAAQRSLYDLD